MRLPLSSWGIWPRDSLSAGESLFGSHLGVWMGTAARPSTAPQMPEMEDERMGRILASRSKARMAGTQQIGVCCRKGPVTRRGALAVTQQLGSEYLGHQETD